MGLGLEGAYGAEGAADALRQIIKDRLAREQQQFNNDRMTANDQRQAEEHAATMQSLGEERAAKADQAKQSILTSITGRMTPRTTLNATDAGPLPDYLKESQPLTAPSAPDSLADGPQGGPMPGTVANSVTPQARNFIYTGTDKQKSDEEQKQLRGRLMSDPSLDPREKLAIEMENAGMKVPAGVFGPKPAGDSAAGDDRRFEQIVTSQNLKRPVTPEDMAWAQAYKTRKTLGPAASSGFADARLNKSEDFSEAQVGRKELTDKVEKPYQDAAAQAATLRDIVTSARAGNKFAAAQQPLEATLATVRQAGLNRINAQELGVSANAGSLWDRIQGAVGKQTAGQPMDPELQQNLLDYADVLEKAAHKRYLQGHKAITTRYGLKDEQPLPAPGGGAAAAKADPLGIR